MRGALYRIFIARFWIKLWALLLPVLFMVGVLLRFCIFSQIGSFIRGGDYPLLEVSLVLFPLFLLLLILKDSLFLLYTSTITFPSSLSVKVIGSQWYWNYEISDFERVSFTSYIKPLDELSFGGSRFTDVDSRLVLPVNRGVLFLVTRRDVIHAFRLPALLVKVDATSGVLNSVPTLFFKTGVFTGQCREICGISHRFIPVVVECVLYSRFYYWLLLFIS